MEEAAILPFSLETSLPIKRNTILGPLPTLKWAQKTEKKKRISVSNKNNKE